MSERGKRSEPLPKTAPKHQQAWFWFLPAGGVRNGVHLPIFYGKFPFLMTLPSDASKTGPPDPSARKVHPLSKVTEAVSKMLDERVGGKQLWVRAEISQFGIKGKHAYLDLVEERNGQRMAQLKGTIWSSRLESIRKALGAEFEEVLKPGREIVFSAYMSFHAVFGFSLNIQEIDLDVLLGEMERRRKETLAALKKEGAIGRNRGVPMAPVPQRLILIGSAGTAGFTDFMAHLGGNDFGYAFDIGTCDATVQGAKAVESLVQALHLAGRVALRMEVDAVVLLRGGGAKLDLDIFNDLTLCRTIASMALPVIVGVGHETDQTLCEFVAHTACKTPTAAAAFIVDRMAAFEGGVEREARAIASESKARLSDHVSFLRQFSTLLTERPLSLVRGERGSLHTNANAVVRRTRTLLAEQLAAMGHARTSLSAVAQVIPEGNKQMLGDVSNQLRREVQRQLRLHEERVGGVKSTLSLLGPETTLKRGFSITRRNGTAVRSSDELVPGDQIVTQLAKGSVISTVQRTDLKQDGNE